mmetsp:Transcript_24401/g.39624  ORF Transcript_24401/g.39624 Transcript_24401/m.39624 type:complete len:140 (+) Transcript_24401:267-686(+)|eukprot:CAMPEP_0203762492 /NCGR_PEP_ID=MMETSP0098-20131031/15368_1 /ASSEMBLY_ACC=CAM_ASM_000208 /TAXON_ID=96639 /ORGANISM=" , Strain NY0313808BC1" /LENGTH=139 /DNA_ID=CAMNT_0050656923 /DNA_START=245 /DNA_END=664 /DNA_ORIENTATION=-
MSVIGFSQDPFFKEFSKLARFSAGKEWPAMGKGMQLDMKETPKEFVLKADVPGVPKKDVDVSVEDGVLTISAHHEQEKTGDDDKIHWSERNIGHVSRSIRLPDNVDIKDIKATQADGVLQVTLPKKGDAQPAVQKIAIN